MLAFSVYVRCLFLCTKRTDVFLTGVGAFTPPEWAHFPQLTGEVLQEWWKKHLVVPAGQQNPQFHGEIFKLQISGQGVFPSAPNPPTR